MSGLGGKTGVGIGRQNLVSGDSSAPTLVVPPQFTGFFGYAIGVPYQRKTLCLLPVECALPRQSNGSMPIATIPHHSLIVFQAVTAFVRLRDIPEGTRLGPNVDDSC